MTYDDWKSTEDDVMDPPEDEDTLTEPLPRFDTLHSHKLVMQLGRAWRAYADAFSRHLASKLTVDSDDRSMYETELLRFHEADREMRAWADLVIK